jgi:hypothetical protein
MHISKFSYDMELHEKILDKVFGQYSGERKTRGWMIFGLGMLYPHSDFFAQIVKRSILWAIDDSRHDVGHFKRLAFGHILLDSCDKEREIRASVGATDSDFGCVS